MNFDAAAIAYVRYVLQTLYLTPGALAKRAGISASTLTRALNDPKHKFKLSTSTLEKIAEASGITPAPFLEAQDSADLTNRVARQALARAKAQEKLEPHNVPTEPSHTLVVGRTGLGRWFEPSVLHFSEHAPISLKSTIYEAKDCFACFCDDDSADMIAERGDIFFCRRVTPELAAEEDNMPPHFASSGNGAVIVERRSRDAFRIELTCRIIKRRHDRRYDLISAGYHDNMDEQAQLEPKVPRLILDSYGGNEVLRIIGSVEWVIRTGRTDEAMSWLFGQPDLADYEKPKKS